MDKRWRNSAYSFKFTITPHCLQDGPLSVNCFPEYVNSYFTRIPSIGVWTENVDGTVMKELVLEFE